MLRNSSMGVLRGLMRGKFSKNQGQRGPMSAKRGNRRWVKGTGTARQGRHTNKGKYIIEPERLMILDVPDLTDCQVRRRDVLRTVLVGGGNVHVSCLFGQALRRVSVSDHSIPIAIPMRLHAAV